MKQGGWGWGGGKDRGEVKKGRQQGRGREEGGVQGLRFSGLIQDGQPHGGPRLGPFPSDCLQSAMGSWPPITPPLRAESVLNIGGKTSEDKTDKAAVSDVAYSPERERASCLQMQDPLFWGKAITETCLIIEMSPGPRRMGKRVPGHPVQQKTRVPCIVIGEWLRTCPLLSECVASNSDSATDLLCDLVQIG